MIYEIYDLDYGWSIKIAGLNSMCKITYMKNNPNINNYESYLHALLRAASNSYIGKFMVDAEHYFNKIKKTFHYGCIEMATIKMNENFFECDYHKGYEFIEIKE